MPGTIADLRKWAETVFPGDEARARTVIRFCISGRVIEPGPHGVNARRMDFADLAAAVVAVLNPGRSSKSAEAVQAIWSLRLASLDVHSMAEGEFSYPEPAMWPNRDRIKEVTAHWDLYPSHLQGANWTDVCATLSVLFAFFAPTRAFAAADRLELVSRGGSFQFRMVLHGPDFGVREDGWPGSGMRVVWTFGELADDPLAVTTVRTLEGASLNELRRLLPSFAEATDG